MGQLYMDSHKFLVKGINILTLSLVKYLLLYWGNLSFTLSHHLFVAAVVLLFQCFVFFSYDLRLLRL